MTGNPMTRKPLAIESHSAAAVKARRGRDLLLFEGGHRDDQLEDRARRIATLESAVLETVILIVHQRLPCVGVETPGKNVRVERRCAGERQHLAVARGRPSPFRWGKARCW